MASKSIRYNYITVILPKNVERFSVIGEVKNKEIVEFSANFKKVLAVAVWSIVRMMFKTFIAALVSTWTRIQRTSALRIVWNVSVSKPLSPSFLKRFHKQSPPKLR